MTDNQQLIHLEAAFIMQNLGGILPNLEKMVAVYYDKDKAGMSAMVTNGSNQTPVTIEFSEDFDYYALVRLREAGNRHVWMEETDLPFKEASTRATQKEVFHEADNSVLLTRIRNRYDKKSDLYILYFNRDASNFGPVRNGDILNTTSKTVIESVIYNAILFYRKQRESQIRDFNKYKIYLGRLRDKTKTVAAKHSKSTDDTKKLKLDFANYILSKIADTKKIDGSLSPEAEDYIIDFQGSFSKMEDWIRDAFDFAWFSDFDPKSPILIIEDWHFQDIEVVDLPQKTNELVEQRYYKTYSLLNRLETAANKVLASRQKLTGAAVGQAMSHAISAPAITDALKKHGKKIVSLMEKYPNRWTLIRSEFKPMLNVLESKANKISKSA